jgi:hypothetical protein
VNKHNLVQAHIYTTDGANYHTDENAYTANTQYTKRNINTYVMRVFMKKCQNFISTCTMRAVSMTGLGL